MIILGQVHGIEFKERSYTFDLVENQGKRVVSIYLDTFYTIEDNCISPAQAHRIASIYHHILKNRYFGFGRHRHQRTFATAEALITAMCADLRRNEIKRLKELKLWGFSNNKG